MDHRPKKDLEKLQRLLDALLEIESMSKEEKSLIDSKMKLVGSDLSRSIQELMQGPDHFLKDIKIPDLKDYPAVKTFLYSMQGVGRRARDELDIVPKWMKPHWTQHHEQPLMGMGKLNKGVTKIQDALDNSKRFSDLTGKEWGTAFENLWEILSDTRVHKGTAHRGNYNDRMQAVQGDTPTAMWEDVHRATAYNAANAQAADSMLINQHAKAFNQDLAVAGGATSPDIYTTENTPDKTRIVRSQISKGAEKLGIRNDINKNNFEAATDPKTVTALHDAHNTKLSPKRHAAALKVLRAAGLFGAVTLANEVYRTAQAGDLEGARNLAIQGGADMVLGDIPLVGDMISPEATAPGTVPAAGGMEETKRQLAIAKNPPKNTWELMVDKATQMKKSVAHKNNPNDFGITEALRINGPNQLKIFADISGALGLGTR